MKYLALIYGDASRWDAFSEDEKESMYVTYRAFADEARDALVANNRRLARYQRKWLRRIPDIVPLDGDRDPREIAAEIVETARLRGMLPA